MEKVKFYNLIIYFVTFCFSFLLFSSIFGSRAILYENYSIYNKYFSESFQTANGFCLYELEEYKSYLVENGANKKIQISIDKDLTLSERFLNKCAGRVTGINTFDLDSTDLTILYVPGNSNNLFGFFPILSFIYFLIFIFIFQIFKKFNILSLNYVSLMYIFFASLYMLRLVNTDENLILDILYTIEPKQAFLRPSILFLIFLITYFALNSKLIINYFYLFLIILFSGFLFKIFYYFNLSAYFVLIISLAICYLFFYKALDKFLSQVKSKLLLSYYEKFIFSIFNTYFVAYILNRDFFCLDTDCEVYHYVIPKMIQNNLTTVYFPYAEVGYGLSQAYTNLFAYTISFLQQVSKLDYLLVGYIFHTFTIFIFLLSVFLLLKKLKIEIKWFTVVLLLFLTTPTYSIYLMPGNYMFILCTLTLLRIYSINLNRRIKFLIDILLFFIGPIGVLTVALINLYDYRNFKLNFIKGVFFGLLLITINFIAGYPLLYPYSDKFLDSTNKLLYKSTLEHLKLSNEHSFEFYGITIHNFYFGHPNIFSFGVIVIICLGIILFRNRRDDIQLFGQIYFFIFSYISTMFLLSYFFPRYYLITSVLIIILCVAGIDSISKNIKNKELSTILFIYIFTISIFAPTYNLEKNDHYITYEHELLQFKKFDNYLANDYDEIILASKFRHEQSTYSSKLANNLNKNDFKVMFGDLRILHLDKLDNYNLLFSDIAYSSYKNSSTIWDTVKDKDIDFSIIAHWTFIEDYWPVLIENNFYINMNEEKMYTFNLCGVDSEAFMLIDHKNQFDKITNESFMKDFCWKKKPIKNYLQRSIRQ